MKMILHILTFGFLLTFCSCKQSTSKEKTLPQHTDSIQIKSIKKELSKEEDWKKQFDEKKRVDSLRLDTVLIEAIKIAKQNISLANYSNEYETTVDTALNVRTNLKIGHLFSTVNRHLLIRRFAPWGNYIDLYLIKDNDLKSVVFRFQGEMTYMDDTIKDVNGDSYKDFLVHWYPSSGCCRREIYNVYLNQTDKGTFTSDYEFINPTFSPKEKIIRGVTYGHPGEVGLYKYKWSGLQVDTIGFIYPDQSDTISRYYFRTNKELYSADNIKRTKLKVVPKEYHNIESYEWFNSY